MPDIHYLDLVNGEDKTWAYSINGATRANPCVLTINVHDLNVDDRIRITGVGGMTQLNNQTYTVTAVAGNQVTIDVNSSAFSVYSSGGTATLYKKIVTAITQANPAVVTCAGHTFTNGQQVWFRSIVGMTELNDNVYTVANVTANTFELSGIDSTSYTAYVSGGYVTRPYLTNAFAFTDTNVTMAVSDSLRIAKTTAATTHALGNTTWTVGSNLVATAVSYVGTVSVGDLIGPTTAAGNGADESFYYVTGIAAGQITLAGYYGGAADLVSPGVKIQPVVAAGPATGAAVYANISCTISGGWELSATPAQNGETWLKPVGVRTGSSNVTYSATASGIIFDRLNAGDGYYGLTVGGSGNTFTNCTFVNAYVYTVSAGGLGHAFSDVRIGHNGGVSWAALNTSSYNATYSDVVVTGYVGPSARAITPTAGYTYDFDGVTVRGAGYGLYMSGTTVVKNIEMYKCQTGVAVTSSYGGVVDGATFEQCTVGILAGITLSGLIIRNCDFNQTGSTGISFTQATKCLVEGCTFNNTTNYDMIFDQYSGHTYSVNNSHVTPGIRAYQISGQSAPIYIKSCTIDAGSVAKVFTQVANDVNTAPEFFIQDSFFGITGQYFGKLEVVKNTSTVPPSVQLKFNTTVSDTYADQKVATTYAKAGVAKTLSYKLTAVSPGWAGSLVPKIKLNGVTIATQTTITSVSYGSDDSYTYNIAGGLITADGELSIEMTASANTVAILVKEFEVS